MADEHMCARNHQDQCQTMQDVGIDKWIRPLSPDVFLNVKVEGQCDKFYTKLLLSGKN